jgi:hypothetical protein
MIVKIQQSKFTNAEKPQMLVYDKKRIYSFQDELTSEVKNLLKGRDKAYFEAKIMESRIVILDEVEAQDW